MMKDWQVRPSDVLIATYAKSGEYITQYIMIGEPLGWAKFSIKCENIIRSLIPATQGCATPHNYVEVGANDDPIAVKCMDKLCSPRIIKTHLYYEFFKKQVEQDGLKVVFVLREPKDVLTSYYYHYCQRMFGFTGDFHQFFDLFRQNRLLGGNIFKMNRDWWQMRHLPNIHVVRYEEMKRDCPGVVQRLGEFLGIPLDQESIDKIVEMTKMENMRKFTVVGRIKDKDGVPLMNTQKFLRKGIVGDWKNHMTQDEVNFVDDCVRKYYDPVGLHFDL
ncbi:hypothetical protein CAPTEDRAFT_6324 [Capitella teleta]|uniref:Sulfotransferase domain-containing protein n=1 Tax=Capitella teleta TaxID=283909 RepID=R7TEK2_CAPTE|nr:hypothetical protein CAPTEDRAFT_6324 [Capitella teleta]|eukprot:ELT91907.1 hypothetical protein CAPTEDRAFT_6324 [Capitella teleta]